MTSSIFISFKYWLFSALFNTRTRTFRLKISAHFYPHFDGIQLSSSKRHEIWSILLQRKWYWLNIIENECKFISWGFYAIYFVLIQRVKESLKFLIPVCLQSFWLVKIVISQCGSNNSEKLLIMKVNNDRYRFLFVLVYFCKLNLVSVFAQMLYNGAFFVFVQRYSGS